MAATLLKGDISLEKRVAKLSLYFQPTPGETLRLDEAEVRDLGNRIPPAKLRGDITVSPPKGVCFTIQRPGDDPDEYVCKATVLKFRYADLDKNGYLKWQVSTGEGDFGTPLSWRSPYRVAIVTPFNKTLADPPEYRFIKSCDAITDPEKGRRIVLGLLGGETWIIRFPDKDALLLQPDPLPNLITNSVTGTKTSVADAEKNNKKAERKDTEGEVAEKAEGEGEAKATKPVEAPQRPQDEDDRVVWAIPRRHAYTMPASNFQPFGSVAPGMKGECRYNFHGPVEDPATGRIECHDVDGFKEVFIPLTCLGQMQQKP